MAGRLAYYATNHHGVLLLFLLIVLCWMLDIVQGNGNSWLKPAAAMLVFDVNHCSLQNPFSFMARTDLSQIWDAKSFEDANGECTDTFHLFRTDRTKYSLSHLEHSYVVLQNPNDCSGSFSWNIPPAASTDEGQFTNGKLLCNNGQILAFLAKLSTSSYLLHYSTNTADVSFNERSGYKDMSQAFLPETGSEFCIDLFSLMTKLLQNIDSVSGKTCGQTTPPLVPPLLTGQCTGTASPCSSTNGGDCGWYSCDEQVWLCRSESTCGQQDGCYCQKHGSNGLNYYLACEGTANPCSSYNNDRGNCLKQSGCSWAGEDPPPTSSTPVPTLPPTLSLSTASTTRSPGVGQQTILPTPPSSSSTLSLQQELFASDGNKEDSFGYSVAIDQDTIIVGAPHDVENGIDHGSAYIFMRNDDGVWTETQKLISSDAAASDWFGDAVAVQGNTAIVGAKFADNMGAYGNGAAYIFRRQGGKEGLSWVESQKLVVPGSETNDHFGEHVAIDGQTAVIAEPYGNGNKGAVFVFVQDGDKWVAETRLVSNGGSPGDEFGRSIDISGDTIVVGVPGKRGDSNIMGYAVVFQRNGNDWDDGFELRPEDGFFQDEFGISVAIDGDTIVIGNTLIGDGESAYVFQRTERKNKWTQKQKLDARGYAVDIWGDVIVASETAFHRSTGGAWEQREELAAHDNLLTSVAISGNTAALGSPFSENSEGRVGVFVVGSESGAAGERASVMVLLFFGVVSVLF